MGGGGAARGRRRKMAGLKRTGSGKLRRDKSIPITSRRRVKLESAVKKSESSRGKSKSRSTKERNSEIENARSAFRMAETHLSNAQRYAENNPYDSYYAGKVSRAEKALESARERLIRLTSDSSAGKQGPVKPWKGKIRSKTKKPIKR